MYKPGNTRMTKLFCLATVIGSALFFWSGTDPAYVPKEEDAMRLNVSNVRPLPLYSSDSVVLGIWMEPGGTDLNGVIRTNFINVLCLKDSSIYFCFYETKPYVDSFEYVSTMPYKAYTCDQGVLLICEKTSSLSLLGTDSLLYQYDLGDSLLYDVAQKINAMEVAFTARKQYMQQCRQNDSLTLIRVNMPYEDTFYYRIYRRKPSDKYYLQLFTPALIKREFPLKDSLVTGGIQFSFETRQLHEGYFLYQYSDSTLNFYSYDMVNNTVKFKLRESMPALQYNYYVTTFDSLFFYGLPVQKDQ